MTKPISPLRQRMIDDMTMRNLSPSTQETYIRAVAQFSTFHRRSPDQLGVEHLREYHLHLVSRGLSANSICVKMSALRFDVPATKIVVGDSRHFEAALPRAQKHSAHGQVHRNHQHYADLETAGRTFSAHPLKHLAPCCCQSCARSLRNCLLLPSLPPGRRQQAYRACKPN